MKINARWLVQALAFIGCIFFFMLMWERSKQMLVETSGRDVAVMLLYLGLFLVCFFVMGVTSYLKQKNNGTLKNPIPFFEKLLSRLGLA